MEKIFQNMAVFLFVLSSIMLISGALQILSMSISLGYFLIVMPISATIWLFTYMYLKADDIPNS